MKKVKYLTIQFKNAISLSELPKFRGAVIACAGQENQLFHNHEAEGGFRYSYPLIQYKRIGQNAGLVCLEEGVHEVHAFFQGRPQSLMLGDREIKPEVEHLQMKEVTLQAWDKMFTFRLSNWLALKPEFYAEYQKMTDENDRLRFLTTILRGNLLSMAKGLGWFIDREVKVNILQISQMRLMTYKNTRLSAFDLRFETNVWVPNFVGVGKGSALGFGMVEEVRNNTKKS
jgi:Cas6b C-terminal domain/Cas6b N-terminal domain